MQVIKDFFEKNNIKDKKIAVGVSGGADSLALVLMLKEELKDTKIKLDVKNKEFELSSEVRQLLDGKIRQKMAILAAENKKLKEYTQKYAAEFEELKKCKTLN